jgi:hypothetical protein
LIKYIKSVLWRVAKCLFYIEEARCLKVKYYECVPVYMPELSVMNITSFLRRIILSRVSCLTVPYFSALSHKWQDFRGKKI